MIHIAIGTKAQFIKMAPIMQRLSDKNIPFNFIDLGQHSLITSNLREEFNLREPDVYLSRGQNISQISKGLLWLIGLFFKGLSASWVKEKVFLNKEGICLIHGDTVSTILALYLAKRAGIKVAHIEAGLRSYNFFEPFPEELIRCVVMRFSDILFAPQAWALNNLKKMGMEKKTVLISANTSLESTFYSLGKNVDLGLGLEKFALITIHRMENIFSKVRLELVLDIIAKIAEKKSVVFVQHQPTINQLKRFQMEEKLKSIKNIYFFKILSHAHFTHLLNKCEFVITDGGSIQEEAFYLNKPCLILRGFTERQEGLGENAMLSGFNQEKINYFIENFKHFQKKDLSMQNIHPAEEIINWLVAKRFNQK